MAVNDPNGIEGTTTPQLLAEISEYWANFRGSNLYNLLDVYNTPMGDMSSTAQKIENWREIKNAEGTTLDLMGKDRKAYRTSDDDELYRFLIYIRFLLSRAQGTIPSIVNLTQSALQKDHGVRVYNVSPHHINIKIPFSEAGSARTEHLILDNLKELCGLGYWLDRLYWDLTTQTHIYIGCAVQQVEKYTTLAPLFGDAKIETNSHDYSATATVTRENHVIQAN